MPRPPSKLERPLTDQQSAFARAYITQPITDRDPEAAALTAGYSPRTAGAQGRRLLMDPRVQREILRFQEGVMKLATIDAAWVLSELGSLWNTPLRRLFDENGALLPIHQLDDQAQKLISGFEVTELTTKNDKGDVSVTTKVGKIKLMNRLKILEDIGGHVDVNAFKGSDGDGLTQSLAELMRAATKAIEMSHNTVPVQGRRIDDDA